MAEASRRAARPAARGGIPNALFVVAAAEAVPAELHGIADLVTINLPVGLAAARRPRARRARPTDGIARLVAPGGRVEMLLAPAGRDRLGRRDRRRATARRRSRAGLASRRPRAQECPPGDACGDRGGAQHLGPQAGPERAGAGERVAYRIALVHPATDSAQSRRPVARCYPRAMLRRTRPVRRRGAADPDRRRRPEPARHPRRAAAADGYEVQTARDGEEALRRLGQAWPDLLIIDMLMPRMDGLTLAREVKARADLPIIVLSAIDTADSKADLLEEVAEDYVTKPYHYPELRARIKRVLRRLGDRVPRQRLELGPNLALELHRREAIVAGKPGVAHADRVAAPLRARRQPRPDRDHRDAARPRLGRHRGRGPELRLGDDAPPAPEGRGRPEPARSTCSRSGASATGWSAPAGSSGHDEGGRLSERISRVDAERRPRRRASPLRSSSSTADLAEAVEARDAGTPSRPTAARVSGSGRA